MGDTSQAFDSQSGGPKSLVAMVNEWRAQFSELAEEEKHTPQDKRLWVCGELAEREIRLQEYEEGKPWVREICVLHTHLPYGLWQYKGGVTDTNERFRALAAEAGKALAAQDGITLCPIESITVEWSSSGNSKTACTTEVGSAEAFFLWRFLRDLRENAVADRRAHQTFLFRSSKNGGAILRVCAAAAVFCSRLLRQAHEQSGSEASAQNNEKATQSAEMKSANKQHKALTDREQRIWKVVQQGPRGLTYCREVDAAKVSPPRKGIWKDAPRTYEAAYKSDERLAHWIQSEKSKIRRKAELAGHARTRPKLASE
jgi:hypothetical protein